MSTTEIASERPSHASHECAYTLREGGHGEDCSCSCHEPAVQSQVEAAKPAPKRASKPWDEHLQERLRTNEDIIEYLEAAVESIESYSPKLELAQLIFCVGDVIKALRSRASVDPSRRAHKVMTLQEYIDHPPKGWHEILALD